MEIVAVDGSDERLYQEYYGVYERSHTYQRPWAAPWRMPEVLAELRNPGIRRRLEMYAGLVDGRVVTAGAISFRLLDSPTHATVIVDTDPDRRGRGHGGAMLEFLEERARQEGRTRLGAEVNYPVDAPADGAGHPYADFATQRGYRFGLGDLQRVLDLPVAAEVLDRLAADAAAHHPAYRLVGFRTPVPEEYLAGYAALDAQVITEAPTGDLEIEPEDPDPAAIRAGEDTRAAMGRTTYTTIALAADGEMAAFSDISVSAHDPAVVYQWGTLVARGHRGHRLGLATKVANLRAVQQAVPDARRIITWNAESNAPMVRVNDALGFRPVERLGEFQKKTG